MVVPKKSDEPVPVQNGPHGQWNREENPSPGNPAELIRANDETYVFSRVRFEQVSSFYFLACLIDGAGFSIVCLMLSHI